ncbi:MAG: Asp-tRNA(Asn)/Glu-tRNA(Gln) amidotransferase subunit GatB [Candidatus Dojkabacteria bacterium]
MYSPVVGLEIHLQVKTKSKMFCRCKSKYFDDAPNTNVCPVCFGLPGALPVPNEEAIKKAISLALALGCTINQNTKFDRKHYFYPDLPKGYQISQYDQPIGVDGFVEIEVEGDARRIRIQRVHIEEDTAKSMHSEGDTTLIDYNKSGVPLIEIVTHPDFESTEEVVLFAKRLRQIVRYLEVSDAEMQKGQMRFELNISVKTDDLPKGQLPDYKVEVKNIGSISVLEKVLDFEVARQSKILETGEKPVQETRGLKDMTGETLSQRVKEEASDYRYFPEPDIAPIHIDEQMIAEIKYAAPELPANRKKRYKELGLENQQADILVEDKARGDWFDILLKLGSNDSTLAKESAKWLIGDISGQLEKRSISISESAVKQDDIIVLVNLLKENKISGTIAKNVIEEIFEKGGNAKNIIESQGLVQISDSNEVEGIVNTVISENAKIVEDMKKNPNAIKFLVGQVMKASKGKVNPKVAEEELRKKLGV